MASGDELFEAEHTGIVDRDRWRRVVDLADRNASQGKPKTKRGRNPAYLLRGVLRCGLCGKAMTPASTRKKSGSEYRYYRCTTRDKEGRKACAASPLPADAIEDFIVERLREATEDGSLAREVRENLDARVRAQRRAIQVEGKALPAEIARLSTEGRNLVETLGQARGAAHRLLEERIEDIGEQLATHERRMAEVQRALTSLARTEIEARWVADSLAHFDTVWDAMNLENRGRLVCAVVETVEIDERSGQVTAVLVDLDLGDDSFLPATLTPPSTETQEARP